MRVVGQALTWVENPSIVGMWVVWGGGTVLKIHTSYNVSALTDNGTGDATFTMVIPYNSASDYAAIASVVNDLSGIGTSEINEPTASAVRVLSFNPSNPASAVDYDPSCLVTVGRR